MFLGVEGGVIHMTEMVASQTLYATITEMVGYTIEKEHIERRYKSPKSRQSGVMCRDVISRERDPKKKNRNGLKNCIE